jgi:hypothetical protein
MSDDRQRKLALERQQRYLARKRGEDVPKLRGGRPRKEAPAAVEQTAGSSPAGWEEWAHQGNRAVFLGAEGGFTHWELGDPKTNTAVLVRFAEGPETWAAIQRLYSSEMTVGVALKVDSKELAVLLRQVVDSIDIPDDDLEVTLKHGEWSKTMLKIGLRTVADFMEYGRFMPSEGEMYHRVDGSKREEES